MATLAEIRAGLATNLRSDAGIGQDFQVSPYLLGDPTPPCIWVFPDEIDYAQAMQEGLDKWTLVVQAFVGGVADQGAQVVLDQLLAPTGAYSVRAAVESDSTLAGVADDLTVTKCTGYQVYDNPAHLKALSSAQLIGAQWTVEVFVSP